MNRAAGRFSRALDELSDVRRGLGLERSQGGEAERVPLLCRMHDCGPSVGARSQQHRRHRCPRAAASRRASSSPRPGRRRRAGRPGAAAWRQQATRHSHEPAQVDDIHSSGCHRRSTMRARPSPPCKKGQGPAVWRFVRTPPQVEWVTCPVKPTNAGTPAPDC